MSTKSYSTYIPTLTRPASRAGTTGSILARFPGRLQWLTRQWKEKSDLIGTLGFELGDERFGGGGYYRISSEQAARERTIDVLSLNVTLTRSR
jgi:hypothetical protein